MTAGALLCTAAVWAAPAATGSLADRLFVKLQAIPLVDSHTHLPDPRHFMDGFKDKKYDVVALLGGGTYVSEFTSGNTWDEVKKSLAVNAHHAYYRPILEAFRDLYGLAPNAELDDSNWKAVSDRMDAAHRDPKWYDEVLRKRANVSHLVWLDSDNRGQAEMPDARYHPIWNIDGFVYLADPDKKTKRWPLDGLREKFKTRISTLRDMESLIDHEIDSFFARGGVSLKSTSAYFRSLDFNDEVSRTTAEPLFNKVRKEQSLSKTQRKDLEDYLMTRVLTACARGNKPFQFHTGNQQNWNVVANSNPLGLNNLLYSGRWWNVKFVILHGGYPFTKEAITLTREFNNCYLDLAWMALFSPAAARQTLSEAIDLLAGNQLMFGTDCANLEETYGTVKFTRKILAEVLAEKIESGFLTEAPALAIARRILNTNAMELYGLKD